MLRRLIAFLILSSVKTLSHIFYRFKFYWNVDRKSIDLKEIRIFALLHHTSLYEFLFIAGLPYSYLWYLTEHISVPGADITVNRPFVGRFWRLMIPNLVPITRKRDESWHYYLNSIKKDDVIMIAPEGRMMRPNGLDKDGKKMTVRGGIAEILEKIDEGKMLICISGGLHHVQAPGELIPRIFKTIKMNCELVDIREYKSKFSKDPKQRKLEIVQDLQYRMENHRPT
jgi:hypothetical protein